MSLLFQELVRPLLIAAGSQWFLVHGMDLVMIRRKNLYWLQIYLLSKTLIETVISVVVNVRYEGNYTWLMLSFLIDCILTVGGYVLFVWSFSDDPAFVLGFLPIMEGFSGLCMLWIVIINRVEGRENVFEIIGSIKPLDLILPVLFIGTYLILRPLLSRILRALARMYQPHRKVQIFAIVAIFLYSRIPAITADQVGRGGGLILSFYTVFIMALSVWVIRIGMRMQQQEKNLLEMQRGLLERRAYLASHISGEAERLRQEISRQMEQLQEELDKGNRIEQESLEQYIERLHELHFGKQRGIYCSDSLVDEILMQIHEDAASRGMEVRIRIHGYDRGIVTEEDLVRLLYYLWAGCQTEGGTLDIDIMTEGQRMVIRFTSSSIHVTRAGNAAIHNITKKYKGEISTGLGRRKKEITVWLKTQ